MHPFYIRSERVGRCRLRNVRVANKGVDWEAPSNRYWSATVTRKEALQILLEGNAEFDAQVCSPPPRRRDLLPLEGYTPRAGVHLRPPRSRSYASPTYT